jgi:hypothetical protein
MRKGHFILVSKQGSPLMTLRSGVALFQLSFIIHFFVGTLLSLLSISKWALPSVPEQKLSRSKWSLAYNLCLGGVISWAKRWSRWNVSFRPCLYFLNSDSFPAPCLRLCWPFLPSQFLFFLPIHKVASKLKTNLADLKCTHRLPHGICPQTLLIQ